MYEQYENPWSGQEQPPVRPRGNLLATAALICAILGIVSSCCLYGAFIFGGLAIVLGLLSRGARKRAVPPARNAIIIGIAAVCISALLTAFSFFVLIRQYGNLDNFMDAYQKTLEQYLGTDMDVPEGDTAVPSLPDDYL